MSTIEIPSLSQLVTEAAEMWQLIRSLFSATKNDIEALESRTTIIESPTLLATLDTTNLPNGARVQTLFPRTTWVLERNSEAVDADGLVITNGEHAFVRQIITDGGYQGVTAWYVSSTGETYADGLTAETPTTIPEVMRRLNNKVSTVVEIRMLNSITTAKVDLTFETPTDPTGRVVVVGSYGRTTLASGTVSTYTAPAVGSTRGELTASINLSGYIGKMCRVTAGARAGTQFPILKHTSNGKAEIGVPEGNAFWGDDTVLQAGDAFVIEDLPMLGGDVSTMGTGNVSFDNVQLGSVDPHSVESSSRVAFFNSCIIRGLDVTFGEVQILNCYIANAMRVSQATVNVFESAVASGATLRCDTRSTVVFYNLISFAPCFVHQAAEAQIAASYYVSFRDCAHTFRVLPGGVVRLVDEDNGAGFLWGENISGTIGRLRVEAKGSVIYKTGSEPTLNGSGTQYRIGGDAKVQADLQYTAANGAAVVHV